MIPLREEDSITISAEDARSNASKVIVPRSKNALATYQNCAQKRCGNLRLRGIRPKITSGMLEYCPANKKPADGKESRKGAPNYVLSRGGGSISVDPWFVNKKFPYKQAPNFIFKDPYWSKLSNDGIVLYINLYNLSQLSYENSKEGRYWINSDGEVFVHCTLQAVQKYLKCGHDKAAKVLKELEEAGLIKKKSRGNGRPAEIVLLEPEMTFVESEPAASEKPNLEVLKSRSCKLAKADTNQTDKANTNKISETHPPHYTRSREAVEEEIKDNISYDILFSELTEYRGSLEVILETIVDTICSDESFIWISGTKHDREKVRERLYAIDDMDIRYVIDKIKDMDQPIKHLPGFCMAKLYEAKNASDSYYESKFRRDLFAGKLQL